VDVARDTAEVARCFGVVAKRFCTVVDSAPNLDRIDLLMQVYRLLPQLIEEAVSLPDLEFSGSMETEEKQIKSLAREMARLTHPQWWQLYQSLKEKLGDWDLYWGVFDPTKEREAVCGSLADDIADIYRDLKEGIILSESDQALLKDIIWQWRFGFFSHWGNHAMEALRTIHFRLEDSLR
jgi:hypothetical protein